MPVGGIKLAPRGPQLTDGCMHWHLRGAVVQTEDEGQPLLLCAWLQVTAWSVPL